MQVANWGQRFKVEMSPINLDRIQSWIDQGRLDPSKPITMKELAKSRCLHGVKRHGVKLLARVSRREPFSHLSPPASHHHGTRNTFEETKRRWAKCTGAGSGEPRGTISSLQANEPKNPEILRPRKP